MEAAGLLRMGEGVRELEEASEGDGVIVPSAEPFTDRVSISESSPTCGNAFLVERVLIVGVPASPRREFGLLAEGAATKCFGASGGLMSLASGWKSIIGRRRCSQLYCLQSSIPRLRGIQVPTGDTRCEDQSSRPVPALVRTLILSIPALHLLVVPLLHLAF